MWLLNWIPDTVFYLILVIGILGLVTGYALGAIPFVNKYKLPIQIVSTFLTVVGVWYAGGIAKESEYLAQIEAANNRAKIAEEKAEAATGKVEYVFVDKVKTVKDVQVVIQERIRDISITVDEQCKIVPEVIEVHNQAAKNTKGPKK